MHYTTSSYLSPSLTTFTSTPNPLARPPSTSASLSGKIPGAVLRPSCPEDIATLVALGYNESSIPFTISARGRGHSVWGQAMARDGVVVDMTSLVNKQHGTTVLYSQSLGHNANVGSQQLWIDVLKETLKHGGAPLTLTDYLYLTVCGTISNAGISGEAFRNGPQISSVYEMDVITGTGDFLTCSPQQHPELFYSVLGGLGQFGIITRARIALGPAPKRSIDLEIVLKDLNHVPEFKFEKDVSCIDFLNRVRVEELKLEGQGLWGVPHLWLNLFVPKSRIADVNTGVFKNIALRKNIRTGYVLVYPMNKNKWDDRMSAVVPDEDIFYTVEFLHSSGFGDWLEFELQNKEVLRFCEDNGIKFKRHLPVYSTKREWMEHFGPKWSTFEENKAQFDPKLLLSPGQRIFNHN